MFHWLRDNRRQVVVDATAIFPTCVLEIIFGASLDNNVLLHFSLVDLFRIA